MENQVEIYTADNNEISVEVKFDAESVWLNRNQMSILFDRDIKTIGKHINNIFSEGELDKDSVVANYATTAADGKNYQVDHYNLDVIISVGYHVKSQRGTQFRQWATKRLKDYLMEGYSINRKRLEQKQQEVQYLKTGIRILNRALEEKLETADAELLRVFSKGLSLLDDYDHETLDKKGVTVKSELKSDVFARPKDDSFQSSINQIRQSFDGAELYPSLEEKAATLLYLIVKNHSFVDGNKRIAAACFLYFMKQNDYLLNLNGEPIISNEALASLTLFIATSKPDEMDIVKSLIISNLNRNNPFSL